MKGICNLTNQSYEIVSMNLKQLAEYFIENYNLTVEDIAHFYRERSSQIRYDGFRGKKTCPEVLDFYRLIAKADKATADYTTIVDCRHELNHIDIVARFAKSLYDRSLEDQIADIKKAHESGETLYRFLGVEELPLEEQEAAQEKTYHMSLWDHKYVQYYKSMSLEEAIDYFKEAHRKILLSLDDTVEHEFNLKYECDFSPIVINQANDKYQLIDGFKRLFTNKLERLDFEAPVKVYANLNDKDYLRILNACNGWKQGGTKFFDRGYIFSLQNRFNIDVTAFGKNQYNFDLVFTLAHFSKGFSFYKENMQFVTDIPMLKELLDTPTPIEPNIAVMKLAMTNYIRIIGYLRVQGINNIDFVDMWKTTLTAKEKEIKKKVNSVGGWAENYFADKVAPVIKDYLTTHGVVLRKNWLDDNDPGAVVSW